MKSRKIILVGERDLAKKAHRAIEASFELFRRECAAPLDYEWVRTSCLTPESVQTRLKDATGIWCAPGSPYESTTGALLAIRYARLEGKTFLGTCGGFQHALIEFARDVLAHAGEHQELAPEAEAPLIVKLSCSLVGAHGKVIATRPEGFREILGAAQSVEEFNCNYGVSSDLAGLFRGTDMEFVAHDELGQVRALRLGGHPFFVGTLFQPERRALAGVLHPVVRAFLNAA